MQVEKQCCTLQQAKRLKELGVEQISQFYWSDFAGSKNELYIRKELGLYGVEVDYFCGLFFVGPGIESFLSAYSAYTVAELGVMIGKGTKAEKNYWLWLNGCVHSVCSPTIAYNVVALAGFVLTQIEEGHLAIEEMNKRLQSS